MLYTVSYSGCHITSNSRLLWERYIYICSAALCKELFRDLKWFSMRQADVLRAAGASPWLDRDGSDSSTASHDDMFSCDQSLESELNGIFFSLGKELCTISKKRINIQSIDSSPELPAAEPPAA